MKKKFLAVLTLSLSLTFGAGATALAAVDEPTSDELFAGYVEQQLYGDSGIMPLGVNAVNNAFADDPFNKKLYELLKAKIENVAANGGSTVFTVSYGDLGIKTSWTWAEWGYTNPTEAQMKEAISKAVPVSEDIFKVLLMDCPYEMYWCNKSTSNAFGIKGPVFSYNSTGFTLTDPLTFTFQVGAEYADGNTTTVKAAVTDVKAKTQEIVNKYKGQSVYNRLLGYKNEICDLVEYDTTATGSSTGVNPWQIINVFDGDKTTNVVCEGYAKAFQYLCDLDGGIDCYTVTGMMSGGTGAGPHMWNIVQLNGKNYLVDVTNCDGNSVGAPDKLFLKAPASGTADTNYIFALSPTITFAYDNDTKALWGSDILTLANTDYDPNEKPADVAVESVTLDKTTAKLIVGVEEQLTATVLPASATDKTVTWKSSDDTVVSVDTNGNVTAKAVGTATITVTTADGGKTATCTVTVTSAEAPAVPVSGVSLDKTALEMNKGDAVTLVAEVLPADASNKTVTWASSDDSVATVDATGKVTAVKAGTATITVTTADGAKTATCTIKVNGSSVTLDNKTLAMVAGSGKSIQLKANVDTKMTDKSVVWTSSNPTVATVDQNGNVTALAGGEATITAAMTADADAKAECVVTVTANPGAKGVYVVNFDVNGGILVGASTVQVLDGSEYKMPTASKSGYKFGGWKHSKDEKNVTAGGAVYTITADTDFIAVWNSTSSGGSHSRPNTSGGSATGTTKPGTTEKPGTTKPGTTTPGTSGTVTSANINNKFADVKNGAWYAEAIAYVYNKGIMNGTDGGKFEPAATTTRAMLVTMLHRLENEPNSGSAKFSDVASGQWFSQAIAWSASVGVVNGYEDGKFGPNDAITREQLAAVLYRYAQFKGYDVSVKGSLDGFSDSGKVSAWAGEAMQWAVGAGIISGNDNGTIAPTANANRAEVAMMIMRFLVNA